jgi:hypothetical protein
MPSIDFQELKRLVPLRMVLRLFHWHPRAHEGKNTYGNCPLCGHRSRHRGCFAVSGDGYYCFHCGSNGDQLRLYAELSGLPLYQACRALCGELRVPVPYLPRWLRSKRKGTEEGLR